MKPKKGEGKRPYLICLMQGSVDGKIMIDRWPDPDAAEDQYERAHALHRADAWLCGRVTMAYFARHQPKPRRALPAANPAADRGDFIAPGKASTYAVAVDAGGKIAWRSNDVNGDRLIVLLAPRASAAHRAHLRARQISYLVTGRGSEIDFAAALAGLRRHFGIRKLMLEGGGRINASLLQAGLIDELSLLLSPVADGCSQTTSLFETDPTQPAQRARGLRLTQVSRRPGGVLWLRYRMQNR